MFGASAGGDAEKGVARDGAFQEEGRGYEEDWQEVVQTPGGEMPKAICPVCEADVRVSQADAVLYSQVRCPECGAVLEVVEENPRELEEVFEGWDDSAR